MLYIVSTPIGNLKDITIRALETLKSVDLIAAEDTRHTKKLLKEYGIDTPLTSNFEHNKLQKSKILLKTLQDGKDIALVTDAGTPGISDPGYRLVEIAQQHDIPVTVIPGATACIAALSLSGLPTDAFIFEGFLPVKKGSRQNKLAKFQDEKRTVIFYESVHRIVKTLIDIAEVLPKARVVVCREMTKKFEEVVQGTAEEVLEHFANQKPKGEFVIVLSNKK